MRVELRRSGGLLPAVQRRSFVVDTATLGAEDSQVLRALVADSGIQAAPDTQPRPVPDAFTYAVTIEDEHGRKTVRLSEHELPHGARALIEWITAHAPQAG